MGFRDHVKKTDYTDPIKLKENVKKEIEKEIKKKDEEEFKKLIRYQNYDIYDAMRDNKNECQYHFYKWYSPDTYREDFSKMAREYYKNYKIDGDKISWE